MSAQREPRPGEVHVVVRDETDGEYQPGPHCLFVETEDAAGRGLGGFENWTDERGLRHIIIPTDEDPRVAQVRAVVAQAEASSLGIDGALQKIAGLVR